MQHLLRDPVHRTISLSSDERSMIDHPYFQRLRRIKQTAFLNLIFPGATHDRFSHSIGAMHMSSKIFDPLADEFIASYGPRALQPSQRDYFRRLVRRAALLHDIGHGPFSHSLEGVSAAGKPIYPTRQALFDSGLIPHHWIAPRGPAATKGWMQKAAQHEDFSVAIIAMISEQNNGQLGGLLAQDIVALMTDWVLPSPEFLNMDKVGPSGKWTMRQSLKSLVSGEVDADRMDYLLRDSLYTGVPYGQYDQEMLLENLLLRPDPEDKKQLCLALRRKALHAFEDFLISRFHMFMQLYSHKTVVGFDVILENAIAELPDFHIEPNLEEYLTWSDDWLLRKIIENRSSRWGMHIRDRMPLKHLFTLRQKEQKLFTDFIKPYELSTGTTAWFPSLKTKGRSNKESVPKIWWRSSINFLTKGLRGHFPLYLEDKKRLIPIEEVSLLLKSDYVRKFEMTHVYCLRNDEDEVKSWLRKKGFSEDIIRQDWSLSES
ncbi:MAG: HD domain-containing protein [Proteobacteria bacterium]|nr:HD domain-containing protein [Pseudomonadota bacterium]